MGYREQEIERIISETVNIMVSDVWRNHDGGWGYTCGKPSDVWSTSEMSDLLSMVSSLLGTKTANVNLQSMLETANQYLVVQQNDDGGWGVEQGKSDATGTELVSIALARSGQRRYHENLARAVKWMEENQNPDDAGWALRGKASVSSIFCTCFGCIALSSLPEALRTPFVEQRLLGIAHTFLLKAQNPDGGWGDIVGAPSVTNATAYSVYTLASVFHLDRLLRPSISWLKRHQNQDGGWGEVKGGEIETTAWAIMALIEMEGTTTSKHIRKGIDYLLRHRGATSKMWTNKAEGIPTTWASYYGLLALSSYVICCQDEVGRKLTLWESIKQIFYSPKANVVFIPSLLLALIILLLQFSNILVHIVGPYSDLLNLMATIIALLSTLWGIGRYLNKY